MIIRMKCVLKSRKKASLSSSAAPFFGVGSRNSVSSSGAYGPAG